MQEACSNQAWISILTGTAKQIAEQLIRPSRWRWPGGRLEASSIGGSKSVSSGSAGYAVLTAVNGGSEPLICDPRAARGPAPIYYPANGQELTKGFNAAAATGPTDE
jgi:hypothetical protein